MDVSLVACLGVLFMFFKWKEILNHHLFLLHSLYQICDKKKTTHSLLPPVAGLIFISTLYVLNCQLVSRFFTAHQQFQIKVTIIHVYIIIFSINVTLCTWCYVLCETRTWQPVLCRIRRVLWSRKDNVQSWGTEVLTQDQDICFVERGLALCPECPVSKSRREESETSTIERQL